MLMEVIMGKRKRTTRRSGIVGRAVSAGQRALREAQNRVPPDLRRRVERSIKDADRTARAAIKELQVQVRRASTRSDVNNLLKRIDSLTKQARQVARGAGARPTSTTRRAATTTRRPATRKRAATTTRRRPATRPATTRRAAATRTTTPRRASSSRRSRASAAPSTPEPIPPYEGESVGVVEIIETTEA